MNKKDKLLLNSKHYSCQCFTFIVCLMFNCPKEILSLLLVLFYNLNRALSFLLRSSRITLPSRPPDRRRRDLFGVANATRPRRPQLHANSSSVPPLQAAGNSSTSDYAEREYDFVEQAVTDRELQISGLKPFTVYRIDIHACNRQVQRCSAAEFVFSRTKPAG